MSKLISLKYNCKWFNSIKCGNDYIQLFDVDQRVSNELYSFDTGLNYNLKPVMIKIHNKYSVTSYIASHFIYDARYNFERINVSSITILCYPIDTDINNISEVPVKVTINTKDIETITFHTIE